ncbi:MAG TPA: S9 family peptidase [Acidobacteriaceae bacterium]|nr:S9 family peptidase [Acidobacteriaceae bacterium]
MRLATSVLLAALALPIAAQRPTQQKRPMTFADLMAMKRVSDPQISPSGKWVLFSVTDVSLEKNTKTNHLWAVPLDGSAKEHQVTFGDGESNGRFAPDGHSIALTMKDQIYTMPWDEAAGTVGSPTQVTNVNGGADGAIWSPDSKRLLFTVSVYPECSDLGDWQKEDACDADKQKAADASPVKAQIWDSLLYRHWDHFTGKRRSHIAVVDADGHNLRDLTPRSAVGDAETPTFSLGGPLGYAWAPDSHEIAYVTNLEVGFAKPGVFPQPGESTNNDIFTLKLDDPNAKAVKVSTSPGSDDGPQYSPDGKYLAWRSQARNGYESDQFKLALMDRATGNLGPLDHVRFDYSETGGGKAANLDMWIDEFVWSDTSKEIFFVSEDRGEAPIYSVNIDGRELRRFGKATGEWSELSLRRVNSNFEMVGSLMRVDRPTEIARFDWLGMDDGTRTIKLDLVGKGPSRDVTQPSFEPKLLTHLNQDVESQISLAPLESFWFAGANGTKVQGFLVKPPNFDPSKKYPVKFLMHGGPQTAWGDAWSYRWNWELFAANGYVVIGINRRGSTGYGQKFVEEVSGDWGGRAYVDLMKGLDFAEAKYPFIDKNRECALGASYGGYMADWVLTHTNRFKCIVTHDGMSDATAAFGDTEELWFNEWEFRPLASNASDAVVEQNRPSHPWDFYGKPDSENPFIKWSPMRYIKDAHTPTLIIHSQRDYRLDVSQGMELFTALQLLGVPSKMLYFPDEGHWVLKPQNSQLWYQTVDDWCDQWLGMNKYAGAGPEKNPAAAKP